MSSQFILAIPDTKDILERHGLLATHGKDKQTGCVTVCWGNVRFSSHRTCEVYLPDAHHYAVRKVLSMITSF